MKIAIDARMIESSGIGTYIKTCLKSGVYSLALGNREIINKYFPDLEVIEFNEKIYSIREQLKFPSKKLKKAKVDLLHIPHYNIPLFYSGKKIVTIHDLTHLYYPEFLPNKFAKYYAKFMLKKAKKATRILTVSNFVKSEIVRLLKAEPEKINVIYNCASNDFCIKDKKETEYVYERFSIPKNKKIIMYVGNLKPHKNLITLLKAYKKIDRLSTTLLLLVGKAFEDTSFEKELNNLPENATVIKTGEVNKNELVDLYNIADIFAFPSLSEGFGIPPLEAMACGTPVVCSDTTSIPEVVGDAGLYFNPLKEDEIKDSINKLFNDSKLYGSLVEKGLRRIIEFNEEKIIKKIKDTLNEYHE